jgi:uncharacterized membrane-anchored protein YitT (DUF2179 family)
MLEFIRKHIISRIARRSGLDAVLPSSFLIAKEYRNLRLTVRSQVRQIFFIIVGMFSAAFGLESFLLPSGFIDGGATGIALLTSELLNIPLAALIIFINIPFIFLGYKMLGWEFMIKTVFAVAGLATILATVPFPDVTHDKLLVAVFGGFFLGAGIGLAVRGGGVLDGTEVLAIFLSRKTSATIGDVILIINVAIFSAAAYLLDIETALYSMITYLAASKTVDFIIEGIEEYTGVTIISSHHEEIIDMITHRLGRGITVYQGKRGYGKTGHVSDVEIIFTVITRLELSSLTTEIEKIDPNAFVVMHSIKDTKGGMIKKRPLH